ncbi:aminopeptidase N [Castellaniella defragrans]|uniref:aminopeptidase N n=1 Tax=Castellaniella defragrans TaxID=75697 RepID=UPI0023F5698F|nr:aminopeptidase N [Castellaniella defragrans]
MRTDTAPTIFRQDYVPYPYRLPRVRLEFDLAAESTRVRSELRFEPAPGTAPGTPLVLQGEDLELVEVRLDGRPLAADEYQLADDTLSLVPPGHGKPFTIGIVSLCRPAENTTLMGLYVSGDKLFTQCEAQGFRRITWFPDRPDVMARFEVLLRADPAAYPLLLSNGNLIEQAGLPDGRHQALWRDPHPKPCYLFALVAGDFDCIERTETTRSGREVLLQVYSDKGYREQTRWALDCLANALHWDERRFGLELDLDRFMVVAARDFNMGAMENKGLNIFNAAYVLADPATATDAAYRGIEAVIGHEYFHNWTGNRVTCRDWFQLSLKEGLTVFRDQEFSADMLAAGLPPAEAASARAVKRIDDVHTLRLAQFPEDAGPMAHPIRPDSYQEIGNFYTATVYEKGAEVIRMQHTLLGEDGFRAGMDEYFRRHDGQAVTCDDFVDAMESIYAQRHPGQDFSVFRRWYEQAGTPRVRVRSHYDPAARACRITLEQRCAPAGLEARQSPPPEKPPLHIPLAIGLIDADGRSMPIQWEGEARDTVVLELREASGTWTLTDIPRAPVLSLLRGFSAPVILETDRTADDLALLARRDPDPFARWDAVQETAHRHLQACIEAGRSGGPQPALDTLLEIWRAALQDERLSPAYQARLLALPALREVIDRGEPMDPQAAVAAWTRTRQALGARLADAWRAAYDALADDGGPYSPDPVSSGRRALRNLALDNLLAGQAPGAVELALAQYRQARNMTESLGALTALLQHAPQDAAGPLADFHARWRDDPLVLDRWFGAQAGAPGCTVAGVRALMALPDFSLRNPNRARAVVFRFCLDNPGNLHTPQGYDFWAEQVLALDALNPEVAARLSRAFDNWARHEPVARAGMQAALRRVLDAPGLSRNVREIVSKALAT